MIPTLYKHTNTQGKTGDSYKHTERLYDTDMREQNCHAKKDEGQLDAVGGVNKRNYVGKMKIGWSMS